LALEETLHRLAIQTIKAQLALRELLCKSLAREYANESLTAAQKGAIAFRYSTAIKETRELRFLLDELEREQNT
jgi:hypothetical protein